MHINTHDLLHIQLNLEHMMRNDRILHTVSDSILGKGSNFAESQRVLRVMLILRPPNIATGSSR